MERTERAWGNERVTAASRVMKTVLEAERRRRGARRHTHVAHQPKNEDKERSPSLLKGPLQKAICRTKTVPLARRQLCTHYHCFVKIERNAREPDLLLATANNLTKYSPTSILQALSLGHYRRLHLQPVMNVAIGRKKQSERRGWVILILWSDVCPGPPVGQPEHTG